MRIGFIADVHLANHKRFGGGTVCGINRRCELVLDALSAACGFAQQEQLDRLFILGDLFDSARATPQVVAAAQRVLAGRKVVVLAGNHDQESPMQMDNALAPLFSHAEVVDTCRVYPEKDVAVVLVPYQTASGDWLGPALERAHGDVQLPRKLPLVLAMHAGLRRPGLPSWLADAPDSIDPAVALAAARKQWPGNPVIGVIAGHWHEHAMWRVPNDGAFACQVGALCPAGFQDAAPGGGYGALMVLENGVLAGVQIDGPRFLKVSGAPIDARMPGEDQLPTAPGTVAPFVSWTVPSAENLWAAREVVARLKAESLIEAAEVLVDDAPAREAAERAAKAVVSTVTLDEALGAYVGEMQLPEGCEKAEVLVACRDYLAR